MVQKMGIEIRKINKSYRKKAVLNGAALSAGE